MTLFRFIQVGLPVVDIRAHAFGGYQPIDPPAQMKVYAGPVPFLCVFTESGANRIQLDVTCRREKVVLVHDE